MVCLDSSFIIDVLKGRERIEDLEERLDSDNEEIFIPSPAIVEVVRGLHLDSTAKHVTDEERDKTHEFLESFSILSFDKEDAVLTGEIEAELMNSGNVMDVEDVMIGAIVKRNNQSLITRNVKHFGRIEGLVVEGY